MRTIAIIGTGRIGTRLAEQLIIDNTVDEIQLWNRSEEKLAGTFASLQVWNELQDSPTKLSILPWTYLTLEKLDSVDAIVIAIKERYDPREINLLSLPRFLPKELRYAGILNDLPLINELCQKLKGYCGTILVVTNPLDVITTLVTKWLPSARVFGLGPSLDTARFTYFVSKEMGRRIPIRACILGGEHGKIMVPISEIWKRNNIEAFLKTEKYEIIAQRVSDLGIEIVKNLGYTLQDCALIFAKDIAWLLNESAVLSDSQANFSIFCESSCIGYPVTRNYRTWKIEPFFDLTDVERKAISSSEKGISEIVRQLENNIL